MPGCVSVFAGFRVTQLLLTALGEGTLSRPSACMDRVSLRGLLLLGWVPRSPNLGSSHASAAMSCAPVTGLDCCCVRLWPCRTQRKDHYRLLRQISADKLESRLNSSSCSETQCFVQPRAVHVSDCLEGMCAQQTCWLLIDVKLIICCVWHQLTQFAMQIGFSERYTSTCN